MIKVTNIQTGETELIAGRAIVRIQKDLEGFGCHIYMVDSRTLQVTETIDDLEISLAAFLWGKIV